MVTAQHVLIVGAKDRQIEELLRAGGYKYSNVPDVGLPALSKRDTVPGGLIILDIRGESSLPSALVSFRQRHPSVGLVIVASGLEPTLMLEAMRAGVSEFVAEPLTLSDLSAALARVGSPKGPHDAGLVLAFIGAKGGVGTTTTAINVATELGRLERGGTLMVDLHVAYGDAAVFLGAEPRFSVVDALENTQRMDGTFLRSLVARTAAGVDLLASSDHATLAPVDVRRIRSLIDFVAHTYRYVVLDCPRSDTAVLDALEAASSIVVVANQELATVRSAGRMATTLRQRYGKDRIKVLVSRYDAKSEIGQDDVERVVGGSVLHLVPSDYRAALEALNSGRPVSLGNHNKLAGSFQRLARDLAGLPPESEANGQSGGGLFGFLGGRRSS